MSDKTIDRCILDSLVTVHYFPGRKLVRWTLFYVVMKYFSLSLYIKPIAVKRKDSHTEKLNKNICPPKRSDGCT